MITVDQESVLLADPCPHHLCSAKKYVIITEEADRDTVSLFFFFFFFWLSYRISIYLSILRLGSAACF